MSQAKDMDTSSTSFTSSVFPSKEDKAARASLSDEQRRAVIAQNENDASQSGIADRTALQDLLNETRADQYR